MPAVPPLAAVAHELRTPLQGVLGCAALLEATPLDAEQRAHLAALVEAARGALAFADDALALARLGAAGAAGAAGADDDGLAAAPVRPAPCDPRPVLAGVVRTLAPAAAARGLALAWDAAPDVPADAPLDAARVREVLLNLAGNAVRVTRRGGVRLSARLTPPAEGAGAPAALALAVADTGPGLTPAARARLFRAWATDGAEGGAEGGAGLGLVLARALAERMGGAIEVESAHGRGSTFTLRLPLPAAA